MFSNWIYISILDQLIFCLVLILIFNFIFYKDIKQISVQFKLSKFIILLNLILLFKISYFILAGYLIKLFILFISFLVLTIWEINWFNNNYNFKLESLVFFLLSICMALLLSQSLDFILIYMVLESQSLIIYTLIVIARIKDISLSIESSLKYFILGGIATICLLLGSAFLYFEFGSTNILIIFKLYTSLINNYYLISLGVTLIFITVLFKLGIAPMHTWSIDVCRGALSFIILFILTIPKIRVISIILNLNDILLFSNIEISYIFKVQLILSLLIGAYGSFYQFSLIRLLGYSSLMNMSIILIGFLCYESYSILIVCIVYFLIYIFITVILLGFVSIFYKFSYYNINSEFFINFINLKDLKSLDINFSVKFVGFGFLIFNLIGIPPLIGFFIKLFLLIEYINYGLLLFSVLILLIGFLSIIVYLRLIKEIYVSL